MTSPLPLLLSLLFRETPSLDKREFLKIKEKRVK